MSPYLVSSGSAFFLMPALTPKYVNTLRHVCCRSLEYCHIGMITAISEGITIVSCTIDMAIVVVDKTLTIIVHPAKLATYFTLLA